MKTLVCFVIGAFLTIESTSAREWTRFRGPNGAGLSDAALPVQWTEKDYNWKVELPGVGHSSPVLWGDKIFVTAGEAPSGKRIIRCLSASDGKTVWTREFESSPYPMHLRNSIATSTPTVDAERLYICWATSESYTVMALDHDGEDLWQTDLGPYKSQHGFGASPIVFDGLVITLNQPDGDGELVALDCQTGKVRWKTPRQGKNATYSTPCVYQPPGRAAELIFTNWQHGITGVDPKTGKVNWELSVFEVTKQERAIASPLVAGDLVLGTAGFVSSQKHFVAVRPGNADKGEQPREVWRLEKAVSYLPTPLVKGNRIFQVSELGIASCLELDTGKIVWQERVPGAYSASPVCAGENIYCVNNDGDVIVLKAADKFELLARNPLGEATQSTPAIAGGRIYFRTQSHLLSLGGSK